eukprot:TRINITY_DN193_c6_g1_i6.p3 TRINITY_DN193_c6_g1~~TRINITY_DN193_c6_g1_i6.p3  ORF type:complete len:172 (-),score=11.76 TRINITY_DN193_c6_g1_i6:781-1296(-)
MKLGLRACTQGCSPPQRTRSHPPLHDINGFIAILAEILPDGPAVQKAVLGSSTCSNMTGNQARDVLSRLLTITKTKGVQHLLCIAMEMLVHFRYNDIPIKYHQEGKCAKEFIFSLIAMHILVFVLEWVSPGRTSEGRGVTSIHSMSHWFDPEDAHPLALSDEELERGNGVS